MALYRCKAIDDNGRKINIIRSGSSETDVRMSLQHTGLIPIKIAEKSSLRNKEIVILKKHASTCSLSVFCRQFGAMYNSGISISECLKLLGNQSADRVIRESACRMYDRVQSGYTFAEALQTEKHIFDELFAEMIRAGEAGGFMPAAMERLTRYYDRKNKTENSLKSSMVYPFILIVVCILVVIFLLTKVVPQFTRIYEGYNTKLPTVTVMMIELSDMLLVNKINVALFTSLLLFLIYAACQNKNILYFIHFLKLKTPVCGDVFMKSAMCEFSGTLAAMSGNGIEITETLRMSAKTTGNYYFVNVTDKIVEKIKCGMSLAQAVESVEFFPAVMSSMIRVGENSGTMHDVMEKSADLFEEDLKIAVNRLTSAFEPVIILIMAVVVGFIVIAAAMPMFDMINIMQ